MRDAREFGEERVAARLLYEQKMFAADPWWAIENGFVFTEDEHAPAGTDARRAFPPKEYLRIITKIHQLKSMGLVMKSRQLMLTWLFCWLLLHKAVTKPGALCVAQGKREEDVLAKGTKGLMGRLRFMRKNLPEHLAPTMLEADNKGQEIYAHPNNQTSAILAVPQGADIVRSLTITDYFGDELAFQPEGEQSWTAMLPAVRGGGKGWGVTTPNGREFCYGMAEERLRWEDWEKWPAVMPGLHGYENLNGVQLIALHYTADPEKRTAEHQTDLRKGYTKIALYRRENELDFSLQPGEGVYINEFNENIHLLKAPYKVNPAAPIYRGWDFGYNGQACGFFQFNMRGQLVWFDLVFRQRIALPVVVQEVLRRTLLHSGAKGDTLTEYVDRPLYDLEGNVIEAARFSERRIATGNLLVFDFGDPSAESHNTKGETDSATLMQFGIQLRTKPTTGRKNDLVEQVRSMLLPRSDGSPALLIAPGPALEMSYVKEAFKGGYHYPETKVGRATKVIPHKDGFYDHIMDQAQYVIDHVKPLRPAAMDDGEIAGDSWRAPEWQDNTLNGMLDDTTDIHIH